MYQHLGSGALDYDPCSYGKSKLLFRGPKRRLDQPYGVVIGGVETYGKFVVNPFVDQLESALDMPFANLGCPNAGLDMYLNEPSLLKLCARARITIVQTLGAQNASNRFYRVHPRRNDRFVAATELLHDLFPKLDFTEFNFTGHLMNSLNRASRRKFWDLVHVLQEHWVARMQLLGASIPSKTILLHVGPANGVKTVFEDPMFVSGEMIARVRPAFDHVQHIQLSDVALAPSVKGKVFCDFEKPAAAVSPGPVVHDQIAQTLQASVRRLIG